MVLLTTDTPWQVGANGLRRTAQGAAARHKTFWPSFPGTPMVAQNVMPANPHKIRGCAGGMQHHFAVSSEKKRAVSRRVCRADAANTPAVQVPQVRVQGGATRCALLCAGCLPPCVRTFAPTRQGSSHRQSSAPPPGSVLAREHARSRFPGSSTTRSVSRAPILWMGCLGRHRRVPVCRSRRVM